MALFQLGEFQSAAGVILPWKIECDALTDEDWACLAATAAPLLFERFHRVVGVPNGGLKFAQAMQRYASPSGITLVCDDVWTTGKSMRACADEQQRLRSVTNLAWIGIVAFARGPLDPNVTALWTLTRVPPQAI